MCGVGLLALLFALIFPPRIFWITYFAATVFASSWGPVAFMSVWSRRITADAAFWGIVSGFIGNCTAKGLSYTGIVKLPVWADPIILGAALSTLVILGVSRFGAVSAAEHRYRAKLHVVPDTERDARDLRNTRRWPSIMMASGVLLSAVMIVFWVLPYRAAIGSVNLISGEFWLSIGCGFVLFACGLALRRHLRDA
jgi:sodium/pantothenate symporter